MQEAATQLTLETRELVKLLDWEDFDFQVDPFDPILDDIRGLFGAPDGRFDDDRMLMLMVIGLNRHATPEIRARMAGELERRAANAFAKARCLAETPRLVLEDVHSTPVVVGLAFELYRRYILKRMLDRRAICSQEEARLDAGLVALARKSGEAEDDAAFADLMRRIEPLGAEEKSPWKEPVPPDGEPFELARLIVQLGDRRAVGRTVHDIHEKQLSAGTIQSIREAFRENGWWGEIEEALAAIGRGETVLVPRGTGGAETLARRIGPAAEAGAAAATFQASLARHEWNRAFHEELEWLRPDDVGPPGPLESAILKELAGAFAHRPGPADAAEAAAKDFDAFQRRWMLTPHPGHGGRAPLAVVLGERLALARHPHVARNRVRHEVNELVLRARDLIEERQVHEARVHLDAVLQIDPENPIARRMAEQIRATAPGTR